MLKAYAFFIPPLACWMTIPERIDTQFDYYLFYDWTFECGITKELTVFGK